MWWWCSTVVVAALVSGAAGQQQCRASSSLRSACSVPGRLTVCVCEGCAACDQEVSKEDYQLAPTVTYQAARRGSLYTLIMVDPDAPDHDPGRSYLHWIISNIPGSEVASGSFVSGNVIADYLAPAPPNGSGAHRYFLLLYLQPGGRVNFSTPSKRPQFELAKWMAAQYPFCLTGPVAATQFRARF